MYILRPFIDEVLSEERQLMKWVGIFQVGIFWVGIFLGGIFLEPPKYSQPFVNVLQNRCS